MAVAVQGAQQQALAQEVRFAVVGSPQAAFVQEPLWLGNDEVGEPSTHGGLDAPPEGLLRAAVPGGDLAAAIHQHHRVEGSVE